MAILEGASGESAIRGDGAGSHCNRPSATPRNFPAGDFREYYFRGDRKAQVVEHVNALRKDLGEGASLPDTALRFCLSHPAVSSVIPGMRTRRHVESNAALSDQGALPPETLAMLKRHAWDRNFYQ